MKKILFALMAVSAVVLTGCSGVSKEQALQMSNTNDSLMLIALQQSNEIAELQGTVVEVSEQLDKINGQITVSNGENKDLVSQRNRLIEKLQFVQESIQEKQKQLDELQQKYSGVLSANKELKRTIDRLQGEAAQNMSTIQKYEQQMAQQGAKIEQLSEVITATKDTLAETIADNVQKQEVLNQQDQMLNAGAFIVAEKSRLKDLGLIQGGLFNKKRLTTKGFDETGFTKIDIREFSELSLNSKDAKILSSHPENSYELVKGADKNLKLIIKDANAFWSNSRFLVVMI